MCSKLKTYFHISSFLKLKDKEFKKSILIFQSLKPTEIVTYFLSLGSA